MWGWACLYAADDDQGENDEETGEAHCHISTDLPDLSVVSAGVFAERDLVPDIHSHCPKVPQHACLQE